MNHLLIEAYNLLMSALLFAAAAGLTYVMTFMT